MPQTPGLEPIHQKWCPNCDRLHFTQGDLHWRSDEKFNVPAGVPIERCFRCYAAIADKTPSSFRYGR